MKQQCPQRPRPLRLSGALHEAHASSGGGFTLLELLVILAIGAGLVAFLLPLLTGMRVESNRIECVVHLRQTGIQLLNYIYESDGLIPLASAPTNDEAMREKIWSEAIVRYYHLEKATERKHLHCPAQKKMENFNSRRPDYAMNYYWGNPGKPQRNIGLVATPSRTALLVESTGPKRGTFYVLPGDPGMAEARAERHVNGVNVLYFDGSVQFLTEQLPTEPTSRFWGRPY